LQTRERVKRAFQLALACGLWFFADHATKFLAVRKLTWGLIHTESDGLLRQLQAFYRVHAPPVRLRYPAFEPFLHFRYVENPGAAFGLLGDLPASTRLPFFFAIGIVCGVVIIRFYMRTLPGQTVMRFGLAAILGGALGNSLDRAIHGYVIDFIDFSWMDRPGMHWPTFNVADVAISLGGLLVFIDVVRETRAAARASQNSLTGVSTPQASSMPEGLSAGAGDTSVPPPVTLP
jgi:signal peptidase II